MNRRALLGWLTTVFATVGAFVTCGIVLQLVCAAVFSEVVAVSTSGFATAFAVVAVPFLTAPASPMGKAVFALLCFVVGACLAWILVGPSGPLNPGYDPSAGTPGSVAPYMWTLAGGLLAIPVGAATVVDEAGA